VAAIFKICAHSLRFGAVSTQALAAGMVMVLGHGAPRQPIDVDVQEPEDAYAIPAH
jgi:hypothetical protein